VIYRIVHSTEYNYGALVSTSHHELHLAPRQYARQWPRAEELEITPTPALRRDHVDSFGNRCAHLEIWEPHRRLAVVSRCEVEVVPAGEAAQPPGGGVPWEIVRDSALRPRDAQGVEVSAFVFASPYVPISAAVAMYAAPSFPAGRPILEGANDLTKRIYRDFKYDQTATTVSTPVEEVLRRKRGVCQDFSHLEIACLRALGLPARYVSGYLSTRPPPGKPRLVGADASHAWLDVYSPGMGWIGFDPTNDMRPDERHITLAWGRDFSDVTPIRGVIMGGGDHELSVSVDVAPVEPA
jgi:transglutaminase-like putative cysteine protease